MAAVMAGLDGLQRPSLEALEPRLVERAELPAAGALSSLVMTTGMIGGPALGGQHSPSEGCQPIVLTARIVVGGEATGRGLDQLVALEATHIPI